MKFSQKIQSFTRNIQKTIRQYPMETLLSILVLSVGYFKVLSDSSHRFFEEGCFLYFPILFLLLNIINFYTQQRAKFLYYIFGAIFCAALFLPFPDNATYYVVALVITILLYIIHQWQSDNTTFAKNCMQLFLSACTAGLIALLTFVLVASICASIAFLFDIYIPDKVFGLAALTCFQCFMPILFLNFYRSSTFVESRSKVIEMIFNYLLTPALLIYTLILATYGLKILIQWELPEGNVAYLVLGFVSLFCLLKMLYPLFGQPIYKVIYKYLFLIVALPLLLFWVGFLYRIQEYGFTETRIYLGLGGLFLTVSAFLLSWQKVGRFTYLLILAILLLVAFTYIPQISSTNIAVKSQTQRFLQSSQALGYPKLNPDLRFPALDSTAENYHLLKTLTNSFEYLSNHTDTLYRKEKLGIIREWELCQILTLHNRMIVDPYYYQYYPNCDNGSEAVAKTKVVLYNEDRDVDISGYTTLQHIADSKPSNNIQSLWYEITEEKISIYDISKPGETLFSADIDSLMRLQIRQSGIDTMDFINDTWITNAEKERLMTIEVQKMRIYLKRIELNTHPIKVIEINPCFLLR